MIRSALWSLGFVAFTPLLVMAQEIDIQTTDGLVTLDVETTCGSAFTNDLSAALEVELAAWRGREVFALCVPRLVRFVFERCDGPGTVRIVVAPLEEELPSSDVSTRALALAAAELVKGAHRRCAAHDASALVAPRPTATELAIPGHDPRPRATDVDQAQYFGEVEWNHRFARRSETIETGVLVRMRAGAFFDAVRTGAGGFADASASVWVTGGLLLRAELGPTALALGEGPGIGQLGGSLHVGYDLGIFAVALDRARLALIRPRSFTGPGSAPRFLNDIRYRIVITNPIQDPCPSRSSAHFKS